MRYLFFERERLVELWLFRRFLFESSRFWLDLLFLTPSRTPTIVYLPVSSSLQFRKSFKNFNKDTKWETLTDSRGGSGLYSDTVRDFFIFTEDVLCREGSFLPKFEPKIIKKNLLSVCLEKILWNLLLDFSLRLDLDIERAIWSCANAASIDFRTFNGQFMKILPFLLQDLSTVPSLMPFCSKWLTKKDFFSHSESFFYLFLLILPSVFQKVLSLPQYSHYYYTCAGKIYEFC